MLIQRTNFKLIDSRRYIRNFSQIFKMRLQKITYTDGPNYPPEYISESSFHIAAVISQGQCIRNKSM